MPSTRQRRIMNTEDVINATKEILAIDCVEPNDQAGTILRITRYMNEHTAAILDRRVEMRDWFTWASTWEHDNISSEFWPDVDELVIRRQGKRMRTVHTHLFELY